MLHYIRTLLHKGPCIHRALLQYNTKSPAYTGLFCSIIQRALHTQGSFAVWYKEPCIHRAILQYDTKSPAYTGLFCSITHRAPSSAQAFWANTLQHISGVCYTKSPAYIGFFCNTATVPREERHLRILDVQLQYERGYSCDLEITAPCNVEYTTLLHYCGTQQ